MRLALAMLPLIPQLLVCSQAQAQGRDPWTTTLSLSRKALGTGECSVVALDRATPARPANDSNLL